MHSALPEFEEELESEEFLGGLARRAAQAVLGSLGGQADGEFEEELELEGEGEFEGEEEDELEGEWEGEFEDEAEGMANPLRRVYPDAMMEHLGHAAAEAETEAEAEAFIGALVPLAAGLARKAAPLIARSTPQLVRGLSTVAHTLRRNPSTRNLVRVLPTIASRTTHSLARQVQRGRPITPQRAIRTLAGQTAAVLSSPQTRNHAVRRARVLDRRYHRATRNGQWWTGAMPGQSVSTVRALAPQAGGAPVRYRYGTPVRYRYGTPVRYRYGTPVRYRYGTPVRYRDGVPVEYGPQYRDGVPVEYGLQYRDGAPARYRYGATAAPGAPVRRIPSRRAATRGYPRPGRLPTGLSIAWVPVPAWRGSQPPPGAYRY
jgi:hypothetical protein